MRYSGILLIPLAWIHVLIQDVLVGVHKIDIDYVALRWANLGWKTYDILLLSFAFAHGMYGLRQVVSEHFPKTTRWMSVLIFLLWIAITVIGAIAIIGGARPGAA
jgi:succinate dehydrogenase / fumarate reductase membrane anchor subunit